MKFMSKIIVRVLLSFLVGPFGFGQEKASFNKLNQVFSGYSYIEQDELGYIRIMNNDGLYKYDGYDFSFTSNRTIFGNDYTDDKEFLFVKDNGNNFWLSSFKGELTRIGTDGSYTSFKKNIVYNSKNVQITSIKALNKEVWFGSVVGTLYKYDNHTSKINRIAGLPQLNNAPQTIKSIAFTSSNDMWISTDKGLIYNYSIKSNTFQQLKGPVNYYKQQVKLTSDKKGRLWIATELQGLYSYDKKNGKKFTQYNNPEGTISKLNYDMFLSIFCDSSGIIWAGTGGYGLYKIDPENNKIVVFEHDEINKFSIGGNTITNINEDSHGNIWMITKRGQINILPKYSNKINYYNGLDNNTPMAVLTILKSSDQSLWLGTDGNGLNRIYPDGSKVQYNYNKKGNYFFEGRCIQKLLEDLNGNIWIGTYQNGLWIYNPKSKTFTKVKTSDSFGKHSPDTRFLFKDSKNRIWVSTGTAINVFSNNQKLLAIYDYNARGLSGSISQSICQDRKGSIWIAVDAGGLFQFKENPIDLSKSYFVKHNYYLKNNRDILNYSINSLAPDLRGNLWMSTDSGTLIKYDLKKNNYVSFANNPALKSISIRAVLIDNSSNNLWLSSTNGIHQYNPSSHTIKSYYSTDGLQGNIFLKRSSYKDKNGMLYFGGEEGVNSFLPSTMKKSGVTPKLYVNNIQILNKPANLIVPDQLAGRNENVKELKLDADQSSFSFQFSAIDNILNSDYYYAYRLKGFDKDWITPTKERIASYTNIPSGTYTFEVRAASKKGEWDIKPKTITIVVAPPFWLSSWAFLFYLIASLYIVYLFYVWLNLKNKLAKEEWQNYKEKEIYALKMNFFTKMSHEIQTPLTLILGPIDDMLDRAFDNNNQLLKQRLLMIKNNAKLLSRIANELMTVRNKELGKLRIFASKNNIINDLKNIAISFAEQARFKNINFTQEYSQDEINIWYDTDKIEHIIYNLLSNAFKFTPKEGTITLKVLLNPTDENVEISVTDSGPGIPKEELDDVFKLFYQSDLGKHNKGTGIGLAFTKELIALHHGEIKVVSSPDTGTCFTVKLSTNETVFAEDEKIYAESSNLGSRSLKEEYKAQEEGLEFKKTEQSSKIHTLLIVEDNVEMQMFLRDILRDTYNLHIAENGKEGIILAEKYNPDLILSDIMMSVMDGIEMCKILQKKKSTSHIPIILLTAKNAPKTKLLGLESGAIEYLRKPFNIHELTLKINNIIEAKEKIVAKYKTDLISSSKEDLGKSKDDEFMEALVNELNNQLDNPDFKLEELSNALNMSYSVIYRKCQEITGKPLVDLVKSLRLKKAALLIINRGFNISEATFMVGYKDSKYFTKCFKEEFGQTPNFIKKETKTIGLEEVLKKYSLDTIPRSV